IHIYGSVVGIGAQADRKFNWQHKGYGTKLIDEATRISKDEAGSELLLVTSGIGVREYYAKRGFKRFMPYMAKPLTKNA
ncbi:MAG: GNAT family N-acetyltransferase, partial [Candidatus Heimdallarchaeota archaeon]|nr:GNAT family N-acetyltransferase [Candidatus Heimdallarchaeota archaeon]